VQENDQKDTGYRVRTSKVSTDKGGKKETPKSKNRSSAGDNKEEAKGVPESTSDADSWHRESPRAVESCRGNDREKEKVLKKSEAQVSQRKGRASQENKIKLAARNQQKKKKQKESETGIEPQIGWGRYDLSRRNHNDGTQPNDAVQHGSKLRLDDVSPLNREDLDSDTGMRLGGRRGRRARNAAPETY